MGFIRGSLFVIFSVFFFVSLLVGNIFLMFHLSLDYETVKPELTNAIKTLANGNFNLDSVLNQNFVIMQSYCRDNTEFAFSQEGYNFNIPCEVINQGPASVIDYGVNQIVEESYYKEYDCSFLNCLKETGSPAFLISEQSRSYFETKFYFVLTLSIILASLLFVLSNNRARTPFVFGTLMIVAASPFAKLGWVLSFVPDARFINFFALFFLKSSNVFGIGLFLGAILIILGIVIKFFSIGFKINNLITWFKKRKDKKIFAPKIIKKKSF